MNQRNLVASITKALPAIRLGEANSSAEPRDYWGEFKALYKADRQAAIASVNVEQLQWILGHGVESEEVCIVRGVLADAEDECVAAALAGLDGSRLAGVEHIYDLTREEVERHDRELWL